MDTPGDLGLGQVFLIIQSSNSGQEFSVVHRFSLFLTTCTNAHIEFYHTRSRLSTLVQQFAQMRTSTR